MHMKQTEIFFAFCAHMIIALVILGPLLQGLSSGRTLSSEQCAVPAFFVGLASLFEVARCARMLAYYFVLC